MKNFLFFFIILFFFTACDAKTPPRFQEATQHTDYKKIPGVTPNEIAAIESLKQQRSSFTYAVLSGTEAFYDTHDEIKGFSPLFCEWLTELLGIPFNLQIQEPPGLFAGLTDKSIDFTGELTATPERLVQFFMTDAIAERPLIMVQLGGENYISENIIPRFAFLEGATTIHDVTRFHSEAFDPVFISSREEAYFLLETHQINAFFDEKPAEFIFDKYENIVVNDFFPLIFSPVSLSTQNHELEPIIAVVQKALDDGAARYLTELYNKGYYEYLQHKLTLRLTPEERHYINTSKPVRFIAESSNYPVSFYDARSQTWQGIAMDVLDEVSLLTGLQFEIINSPNDQWGDMLDMLSKNEGAMISELIWNEEREQQFIWPDASFMTDQYVLISSSDFPNLNYNEIFFVNIGLLKGTAHAEAFKSWFPGHRNVIEYTDSDAHYDALIQGEVDMVMGTHHKLLTLTNYHELTNYKANVVFNYSYESTFGLHKDEETLCSIMGHALEMIDTEWITGQWMRKTYDYRIKVAEARLPWIMGAVVLGCVLLLAIIILQEKHGSEKQLKVLVKKRTAELETQTAILKSIFDSSPDLMFCMDLDLNYLRINKAMENHFNFKEEDVLGKKDAQCLNLPQDVVGKIIEMDLLVILKKEVLTIEEFVPTYDGTDMYFETTKAPLWQNGEMIGILGIAHDITKRKAMEEELKSASNYKSSFLANMSHELRTPLNVIIGLTGLMLEEEELPEAIRANHISISNAGGTLLSIVNDILDISKIESGKLTFVPDKYHIPSIINDTVTLINTYIGEKPLVFSLHIPEDLPGMLFGDELRVKQIMNNLLSNAVKYTRQGSVELHVHSEPDTDTTMFLYITVKDTGIGMSKEAMTGLFSDYYQADRRANRKTEGTGLGLSITKRLTEMMDGSIEVESEYGKGSVFKVCIKQGVVSDTVIGKNVAESLMNFTFSDDKRTTANKLVRADLSRARVLVVDDMQNNLDVAAGLMRKYKMKVDCVTSGKQAVERIKAGMPVYNAIFMDHMMPEMDGIETVKIIRGLESEYARHIPIIALTANAITGTEKLFLENGFQDYLFKPIDIMLLDGLLKKWVRERLLEKTNEIPEPVSGQEEDKIDIDIPGVDAKRGLSHYGNDKEIYIAVLRSYGVNTPNSLEWLKRITEETMPEGIIVSHGIKGSSANICAEQVRTAAAELEAAARCGDVNRFLTLRTSFLLDAEYVVANVNAWINTYDESHEKPTQREPSHELLHKLRLACESFDMSGIDDIMDELESVRYDLGGELVEWLREMIDISELDEVIKKIEEYIHG